MNPITDGERHRLFSAAASSHVEIQVLRAPFFPSLLLEFTPFFYIMAISINETYKRRKYAYVTIGSLVFVYCTYIPSIRPPPKSIDYMNVPLHLLFLFYYYLNFHHYSADDYYFHFFFG